MNNRNVKNRSNKPRSAKVTKSRKASKPARTDRELEDSVAERLDRESLARLNASDAPPHPAAAAEREKKGEFEKRTFGRRFDTELRPGMVINDCPGERIGVVWHAFNALDLCIYMAQDCKLYSCRIQDVFIEPRPRGEGASHFFPLDMYPPQAYTRDMMKPMHQIDGLLIKIGDLLSALRDIAVPAELELIAEYPSSVREHLSHAVSEINEWRANWMDSIIGNVETSRTFDRPLRSADELRKSGEAYAA